MKQIPQVKDLRNILILRAFDSVSKAVVSSCVYREMKRVNPSLQITVACFHHPYDYLQHNPYIDSVIRLPHGGIGLWSKAFQLRAKHFDLVLDTSDRAATDWKWFKRFVGGLRLLDRDTSPVQPFGAPDKHAAVHEQAVLKLLGVPDPDGSYELTIPSTTRQKTEDWLASQHLSSYILLNSGGTSKDRQFRPNVLYKIACICKQWGYPFVLTVPSEEANRWQPIFQEMPEVRIKIADDQFERFELVRRATFIITPDTSAVSIADAFQKPLLIFYNHLTSYNAPDNPKAYILETDPANINQFDWDKFTVLVEKIKPTL